jgi:hypothetical protein
MTMDTMTRWHSRDAVPEVAGQFVEYEDALAYGDARVKEIADENAKLRTMLALAYAGASLYADDGELQDARAYPVIDFRRDAVGVIKQKLLERAIGSCLPPLDPPTGGEADH